MDKPMLDKRPPSVFRSEPEERFRPPRPRPYTMGEAVLCVWADLCTAFAMASWWTWESRRWLSGRDQAVAWDRRSHRIERRIKKLRQKNRPAPRMRRGR